MTIAVCGVSLSQTLPSPRRVARWLPFGGGLRTLGHAGGSFPTPIPEGPPFGWTRAGAHL
jgi:hypothetical protein